MFNMMKLEKIASVLLVFVKFKLGDASVKLVFVKYKLGVVFGFVN